MKTVRLANKKVAEFIPVYALPVAKWYGSAFAENCVEAPDDVKIGQVYDAETGLFSDPIVEEREPSTADILSSLIEAVALLTDTDISGEESA